MLSGQESQLSGGRVTPIKLSLLSFFAGILCWEGSLTFCTDAHCSKVPQLNGGGIGPVKLSLLQPLAGTLTKGKMLFGQSLDEAKLDSLTSQL